MTDNSLDTLVASDLEMQVSLSPDTHINTTLAGDTDIHVSLSEDTHIDVELSGDAEIQVLITAEGEKGEKGDSLEYAWNGTSLGVKTNKETTYNYVNLVGGDNGGIETFVFTQQVASLGWTINHPLNKYPSITIVDSAGSLVVGEVTYVSLTQVLVEFSSEFSGKAYLN